MIPAYDPRRNAVRSLAALAVWQSGATEPALEPDLPMVDSHHHLWRRDSGNYLPGDLASDAGGHAVVATVCIECGAGYRPDGPEELRPVGETEFIAAEAAGASNGVGAAIVGRADLRLGTRVQEVLNAHIEAGQGRFRGIRQPLRWDAAGIGMFGKPGPRGLALDPDFREGFAALAPLGLSFDAWLFHPQLDELVDLARAFPDTAIILNHVGGPLGVGAYAGRRDEVLALWRHGIAALAQCPNVLVKVGGLGMLYYGFDFHERAVPPGSTELAAAWRPYAEECFDRFGIDRCLFESNFPVDKQSCSYNALANAFKRLTRGFSEAERSAFFSRNAARTYRIEIDRARHDTVPAGEEARP
ncbi:amidohydrolase family protein [Inquilinus sp. CA228]|uniref:amidohydrolase family protein n=1 Tax=Inquilinus sp. CA228 TaxID=3455609 RepID=UPI003F8CF2BC